MLKSKLHNPIIAKNSHLENAVVEKVNLANEQVFSDLGNATPVVPETGRVWYNTESGTFKFANIGAGGNGENYVDEFLSRTDLRPQTVASKVDFKDTVKVLNTDGTEQLVVDSSTKTITVDNSTAINITTADISAAVSGTITITDGTNDKIVADNTNNSLIINYANIGTVGQTVNVTAASDFTVNDGVSDKLVLDNTGDSATINYATITANTTTTEINATNATANVGNVLKLTDGTNDKIVADNTNNTLDVNYAETTITGNATVDGNMVVTGDLTVGGQTTKVDVQSESMVIADNVIVLNSNLESDVDPRLASAIVDGTDVDHDAGVAVNRGSEGVLELIKWIESTDTTTTETLKEGTANVSIWNYEAATPAYELHQIIDAYTLGREVKDLSGAKWVGYDGETGTNYANAIGSGATDAEASEYAFKVDAGKLDSTIDQIVQEIDAVKFDDMNSARVGETPSAGTEFTITHGLGTVFVDVKIQREEAGNWYFDVLPIQVIDSNTIKVVATESTKIRYMISAIQGFDVNQATELTIA
jgi:hypothetical protein